MPWGAGLPRTGRLDTWAAGQGQEGDQGATSLKLLYWGLFVGTAERSPCYTGVERH